MKHIYLFNSVGDCVSRTEINGTDQQIAEMIQEMAARNNASNHVVLDEFHPLTHVHYVNGLITIEAPPPRQLDYREKRFLEYPPITDQLDAFWKGGAEAESMIAKVRAVKEKYPKPI